MALGVLLRVAVLLAAAEFVACDNVKHPSAKTAYVTILNDYTAVAGLTSNIRLKQYTDDGFKTILSQSIFSDTTDLGDGERLLDTTEERDFATRVANLKFDNVLEAEENWKTEAAFDKFSEKFEALTDKPILVHCGTKYSALFLTNLYLTKKKIDGGEDAQEATKEFYRLGASLGFSFGSDDVLTELVKQVTGVQLEDPPTADVEPTDWYKKANWKIKPVYKNWFASHQVQTNELKVYKGVFKAFINVRKGVTSGEDDTPSQEEVTLLNIKDKTGTYSSTGTTFRQTQERLEQTIINPDLPNEFISETSEVNYESRNPREYGDSVGYNEMLEKEAVTKEGFRYYHIPIANLDVFNEDFYEENVATLEETFGKPVLVHCGTAYRAVVLALAGAITEHKLSVDWALQKAKDLRYDVKDNMKEFFEKAAEYAKKPKPTKPPNGANQATSALWWPTVALLLYKNIP